MRAIVYLRMSLDQANDGLGIERQRTECERLCTARGYDITETIIDNSVSASKRGRPGYTRLLSMIEAKQVDVVVILRIDRLMRLNDELEELVGLSERTGVKVVTCEGDVDITTPQGRLIARILVSVARNEMENKSSRHKLANAQKAAAGKPHGSRRAYGYESDLVTIRESEAAVLREMARRLIAQHSYKEIAFWANSQGHATAEGRLWYAVTVRQQLSRVRYAGIRSYNGAEYPAVWEPIFDPQMWEQIKLSIKLRSQPSGAPKARKYLLTGLVFCGKCGHPLTGVRRQEHGVWKRAYFCNRIGDTQRQGGCGGIRRSADALDDFAVECLFYRLDTPELGKLLTSGDSSDSTLNSLLVARQAQQQRLDSLIDDYATGLLAKDQLQRAKATSEHELSRIDGEIERLNRERIHIEVPVGHTLRQYWDTSDSQEWRRSLMALLVKRIVVKPGLGRPRYKEWKFDTSLIEIDWQL